MKDGSGGFRAASAVAVDRPLGEWRAGEVFRALKFARHDLGAARKAERKQESICRAHHQEVLALLWGMAEAARAMWGGAGTREEAAADPFRKLLEAASANDGIAVGRERAAKLSVLARERHFPARVKTIGERLEEVLRQTSGPWEKLQELTATTKLRESRVKELEVELPKARTRDWMGALRVATGLGWVSAVVFSGPALVRLVEVEEAEPRIGAGPSSGQYHGPSGPSPVLFTPLAFALVVTGVLTWAKRRARRGSRRSGV